MYRYLIILFIVLVFLASCGKDPVSSGNAPADHTVSKDGIKHKPGLTNPAENCISCHGDDLQGDPVQVSCYSCHGKKW